MNKNKGYLNKQKEKLIMNRRNFITTLTTGLIGLFIPKSNASIIKNTPSKEYPIHFDYWSEFADKLVSVKFKENHMEERVIGKNGAIYNNPTKEYVTSDVVYYCHTCYYNTVYVSKNRFGSTGYFSKKDFAEQMTNIIKMEYPRRQISFGTTSEHKTRLTHFTI